MSSKKRVAGDECAVPDRRPDPLPGLCPGVVMAVTYSGVRVSATCGENWYEDQEVRPISEFQAQTTRKP